LGRLGLRYPPEVPPELELPVVLPELCARHNTSPICKFVQPLLMEGLSCSMVATLTPVLDEIPLHVSPDTTVYVLVHVAADAPAAKYRAKMHVNTTAAFIIIIIW